MRLPLVGSPRISTEFMAPGTGSLGKHLGIDCAVPTGTAVYAPGDGKVTQVYTGVSGGKTIEIQIHGMLWRFLHLSKQLVRAGQLVEEGQHIGDSGATGQVTGPHLHVDARLDGTLWNASLKNYRDPRVVVEEANRPANHVLRLYFDPIGQTATFYKVRGGTFAMKIKDPSYNWRVLENQGNRVRVNSASAGGDCWVYLKYTATGKPIPGRYIK